jgi:hypothetical protein
MCQMAGLLANNEVKRAWKQMATCIHVLGSVYALQSEYDVACIYIMVTGHLYSLCLHDVLVVILCTVQLRIVLLVELNPLCSLMFGHALLYRTLVIQCKFTR